MDHADGQTMSARFLFFRKKDGAQKLRTAENSAGAKALALFDGWDLKLVHAALGKFATV